MDGTLRVQIGDLPQAWTEATWVVLSATQEGFHRGEYLSAATSDADGVCTLGFPSDQPTGFVYAVLDLERDGLDPGDLSFPLDRLPRDLEDGDEDAFSFDALTLLAARSEKEGLPPALDALVAPAPFLFWLYLPLLPFLLWWLRRRIGAMQLPAKVQESPTRPRRAFEALAAFAVHPPPDFGADRVDALDFTAGMRAVDLFSVYLEEDRGQRSEREERWATDRCDRPTLGDRDALIAGEQLCREKGGGQRAREGRVAERLHRGDDFGRAAIALWCGSGQNAEIGEFAP